MVLGNDRLDVPVPVEMRCSEPAWLDSTRTHRRQHCFASSSSLRSRFQYSSSPHLFFFSTASLLLFTDVSFFFLAESFFFFSLAVFFFSAAAFFFFAIDSFFFFSSASSLLFFSASRVFGDIVFQ
uniref:Transmembrane protein n=1 Tax=Brassica oleracea var. oleracea TaxID=109376 RepID=A0A0D3A6G6_BRAOL